MLDNIPNKKEHDMPLNFNQSLIQLTLHVRHSDRAAPSRALRHDLVVLHQVDKRRPRRPDGLPRERVRSRVRELDLPKVRERHELAAHREVLNDPLRVLLAQCGLLRERVRDGLARRLVRDGGFSGRLGRRGHGHLDVIACLEADAREVGRGRGEPLVPRWRTRRVSVNRRVGRWPGRLHGDSPS